MDPEIFSILLVVGLFMLGVVSPGPKWGGIVVSSILWRTGLALLFSRGRVRTLYSRFRRGAEALCGAVLILVGLRLAVSGRSR